MIPPVVRSPASWSDRARFGLVLAVFCACKGSGSEASKPVPTVAREPERFQFSVPESYLERELRGDGSETLRAPPGAEVRARGSDVSVESGSDFALEVQFRPSAGLPTAPAGTRTALSENDVVIFESGGSYTFVVLRELVPEWDETERRRIGCRSAGSAPAGGAAPRGFSRAAVERMVAACRSLALPQLE